MIIVIACLAAFILASAGVGIIWSGTREPEHNENVMVYIVLIRTSAADTSFEVQQATRDANWTYVTIILERVSPTPNSATFNPTHSELESGTHESATQILTCDYPVNQFYGVSCTVTDVDGDGYMEEGDQLSFAGGSGVFVDGAVFKVTLFFEPHAGEMGEIQFEV